MPACCGDDLAATYLTAYATPQPIQTRVNKRRILTEKPASVFGAPQRATMGSRDPMRSLLESSLRLGLRGARIGLNRASIAAKSSSLIRSLLADLDNSEGFADLSEHELMVADAVRMDAYNAAIARYIRPEHVVADLGTGTGILAIFAARQKARKVYAIEHSQFIEVAKQVARHNGMDGIRFVRSNSRSFAPDELLDVIIHEQMGNSLFCEKMLENILDLKRRALKPTGRILPGQFELFLEPISLDPRLKVPRIWEQNICGVDFSCLEDQEVLSPFRHRGYDCADLDRGFRNFLCHPEPVLSLDLNQMISPVELPTVLKGSRKVVHSGSLDGICLHFRAIFSDDIAIDTSPLCPPTHWGNTLFRMQSRRVAEGDTLHYRFEITDRNDIDTWRLAID
jgi:protein arginine N-methyltransferase 1